MAYLTIASSGPTKPLPPGKTLVLLSGAVSENSEITFQLDADTVLFSLWVGDLTGTLTVRAYTAAKAGEEIQVAEFPVLTTETGELLLRKAAVAMSTVVVRIDVTGSATIDLRAKGLGTGDASVKIQGASVWSVSKTTATTVASELVPATLTDRAGLVIKNFGANFLFVAETEAKATTAIGYPIGPGESLAFDLQAGQAIWGVSDVGSLDIRCAQAGES